MIVDKIDIKAIHKNIRRNIRSILDISELKSARKLSLILNQNERYITRILSEERDITFDTIFKISKLFNVSLDLLCISETKFIRLYTQPEKIAELTKRANILWCEYKDNT